MESRMHRQQRVQHQQRLHQQHRLHHQHLPWRVPLYLVAIGSAAAAWSCNDEAPPPDRNPTVDETPTMHEPYVVVVETMMHVLPTEAKVVPNPFAKGDTTNDVGSLLRAQRVTVTRLRDDYARVVRPDGAEGWTRLMTLRPASEVTVATVLTQVPTFRETSEEAVDAATTLTPGSLVIGVDDVDIFTRVLFPDGEERWVRTADLSLDPDEIAVAEAIQKVLWSKRHDDMMSPYYSLLHKMEMAHPEARLLGTLHRVIAEPAY